MPQAKLPQKRVEIAISGLVQGVGFRPFIYRLACAHNLAGSVSNTGTGVRIDVQGVESAVSRFSEEIIQQKPIHAKVAEFVVTPLPLADFTSFQIAVSESDSDRALPLLPDTAICKRCVQELFDPKNRRYQYPFLHCISCGPRFSLFLSTPFDRGNTTMREFCMCDDCKREYDDPGDRRFFSQTNCCQMCGPKLQLLDGNQNVIGNQKTALTLAARHLQEGRIIAMKNTGGYLLLADAGNEEVVRKLRQRKRRQGKPFAILMSTLDEVERIAYVGPEEKDALRSAAAPIVLLKKRENNQNVAFLVSHESPYHGVMLAHNALQHLLLLYFGGPLVATSGNISGKPLCVDEKEAFDALSGVADLFLIHNRKIRHRLDDSIVQVISGQPVIMRRARGYTPSAIPVPNDLKCIAGQNLFAAGSHMKNSFAFLKNRHIILGQHMGDLDSFDNCKAYDAEVNHWEKLLGLDHLPGVSDNHPDYYGTRYLKQKGLCGYQVQHHHAHVWAGMCDNGIKLPFLGISWDGTGWGNDKTVWGGEAFYVTEDSMDRIGSLYSFPLPGGEVAVKEPRRSLLGVLHVLFGDDLPDHYPLCLKEEFTTSELLVMTMALKKNINSPFCTSVGRLFDGVSALLGLCFRSDFEGQAALALEKAAYESSNDKVRYQIPLVKEKQLSVLDWRPMLKEILKDIKKEHSVPDIAKAFHDALAQGIVELAKLAGLETVLLTGGVMQNKLLVEKAVVHLKAAGFNPCIHRNIPPNDGGIAVGQLIGSLYQNHAMEKNDVPSLTR